MYPSPDFLIYFFYYRWLMCLSKAKVMATPGWCTVFRRAEQCSCRCLSTRPEQLFSIPTFQSHPSTSIIDPVVSFLFSISCIITGFVQMMQLSILHHQEGPSPPPREFFFCHCCLFGGKALEFCKAPRDHSYYKRPYINR